VSGVHEVRQMLPPDTSLIVLSASPSSDYETWPAKPAPTLINGEVGGAAQINLREFLTDGWKTRNAPRHSRQTFQAPETANCSSCWTVA
jgi:hypothetical protein